VSCTGARAWGQTVLTELVDWLQQPVFRALGAPVSRAELIGFLSGVLTVYLVARQNVLNWPISIVNVVMYFVVFWVSGLYADSGLQLVYLALAGYGWWQWLFGGRDHSRLTVTRTTRTEWLFLAAAGIAITAILWVILRHQTNSTVPLADSVTTALSLMATYGQSRKKLESWWLWITADLIYIPLYGYKDLWLTALLYLVFLALCVLGLREWSRAVRREPEPVTV